MKRRRRHVLGTLSAVALFAGVAGWHDALGAPAPAAAAPPTTLRVGESSEPLPLIAAIDKGYFARQHIDIQLIRLGGTTPAHISALIGGSEDIVYGDTLAWDSALANGLKLEIFQAASEGERGPAPGQSALTGATTLLVAPSCAIRKPADLRGKLIGVSPTPLVRLLMRLWLQRNRVDPDSVKFVPISTALGMSSALKNGNVDAILDWDPNTQLAQKDYGFVAIGAPSRETPRGTTQAAYFSTDAWLASHPDLAKAFAIAIREGARWANAATPADKAAVLAKFTPVDLARLQTQVPGLVKSFHYYYWIDGAIDLDATQRWVDLAVKYGILEKSVPIKEHLFPTALAQTLR